MKWSKTLPVIANILSALLFFAAYSIRPVIWFLVAAGVNVIVAILIVMLFNKFEKRYAGILNKSETNGSPE